MRANALKRDASKSDELIQQAKADPTCSQVRYGTVRYCTEPATMCRKEKWPYWVLQSQQALKCRACSDPAYAAASPIACAAPNGRDRLSDSMTCLSSLWSTSFPTVHAAPNRPAGFNGDFRTASSDKRTNLFSVCPPLTAACQPHALCPRKRNDDDDDGDDAILGRRFLNTVQCCRTPIRLDFARLVPQSGDVSALVEVLLPVQ